MTEENVLGFLSIEPGAAHAPYDQIRQGILEAIGDGRLVAGTRLPSVRALAGALGVAVNTVARAYKELEAAGAVATQGRHGTRVQAAGDASAAHLQAAAQAFAQAAHTWGIEGEAALDYVRAALNSR